MGLLQNLLRDFLRFLEFFGHGANTLPVPPILPQDASNIPTPTTPTSSPIVPAQPLQWNTKENIIHSIRVIADEEGLPLGRNVNIGGKQYQLKDTLVATIHGESEFDLNAKNYNYAFRTVKDKDGGSHVEKYIASTDYGICQWNDFYHKDEITPDEALHNPEKSCRLMTRYWKKDEQHRRQWIAYKSGRFLEFL